MKKEQANQNSAKFCTKCGNELLPESVFCDNCGVALANEQPDSVQESVEAQLPEEIPNPTESTLKKEKKKKLSMPLTVIICTLMLSITFLIAFYMYLQENPENCRHNWDAPTCVEPARCYECGSYKDEKLGNHKFYYDNLANDYLCDYCDLSKEEYEASNQ